ncbi:hypothetical protein G3A_07855 [Bacillus sp. 17376]|nr:hypothetical protein G3A_07855 [Bacillus sp. 17376]
MLHCPKQREYGEKGKAGHLALPEMKETNQKGEAEFLHNPNNKAK